MVKYFLSKFLHYCISKEFVYFKQICYCYHHNYQEQKEKKVDLKKRGGHLLSHLQQCLVVTLPFGPPLCCFLLQLLYLLCHLWENRQLTVSRESSETKGSGSVAVSHLLHLLSESSEDLVAFGQSALKLFKLVHVQRELSDRNRGEMSVMTPIEQFHLLYLAYCAKSKS